jgi:hypothetical protein
MLDINGSYHHTKYFWVKSPFFLDCYQGKLQQNRMEFGFKSEQNVEA